MARVGRGHAGWITAVSFAAAAFAQQPAVRATGRACDENGKPVAGAAVGAFGPYQFVDTQALLAHPTTTTADDGSFAIAVGPAFLYGCVVVAAPRRQACALRLDDRLATDGGELAPVLLVPGASLTGRVRDESGAPLAGARVAITSSIADRAVPTASLRAGAVSAGNGIFTVPCVPRTGMRLVVECTGYLTESRLVAQETPADIALRKVGVVHGRVVDAAGEPVAGADVHPITVETRDGYEQVRSAADGTFVVTVPGTGRFRIGAGLRNGDAYREFSSGLLHGAADDVVVGEPAARDARATIEVVVVDAATRAPIETFGLSVQAGGAVDESTMFMHSLQRRDYRSKANVVAAAQNGRAPAVVVDAPGHAFEVVPVPYDQTGPLVVALGPEAVLTGTVVDDETGQPLAGVAVRALPVGRGGSGSGGMAEQSGPRTDKDGRYRVGGLRPGNYRVQAHAPDRVASAPASAKVELGRETTLRLTVPKRRWFEFELTGDLPDGAPCRVSFGIGMTFHGSPQGYQHYLQEPPPLQVTHAGKVRFGPVGSGSRSLQLFVPSRTRVGTGTMLHLGDLEPDVPATIALPVLDRHLVRGRVALPDHVPSERIAVAARPVVEKGRERFLLWQEEPNVAGVDGSGGFVLDLPAGSYRVQVFDLLTGIAFHTEEQPVAVGKDMPQLVLKPEVHWLELDLAPAAPGGEVVLQSIGVDLPRPGASLDAFLQSWGGSNDVEHGSVPFRAGAVHERWLVPAAAHVAIKAYQTFEILQPWAQGYSGKVVDEASLDVSAPVAHVTLKVPPPPSDEELLQQKR
jgi:protocatechuate 3,4-dioxygenase beta subunit